MFSTVRRFIKTAILFLFVGLAYGASLLYRREILGIRPSPHQVSAHAHVVGIGFVIFLILGVALWLFPRPAKHDERYRPERIGIAWWILAPATATRFIAEAAGPGAPGGWLGWTILAARAWHRSPGSPSTFIRCGPGSGPSEAISGKIRARSSDRSAGPQTIVRLACRAFQTRSGVNGSRSMRTPTAS